MYDAVYDTITIAHSSAIPIHYNGNDDIRLCADVNADFIYGTVSRWLWMDSGYVSIGAYLDLNVSLLGVRCTMTPSQLNTRLLFKYITKTMAYTRLCADVDVD